MKFGGIGVPELIIILVVALLIFGPKNLPKLGAALGKTVKNVRDGMNSSEKEPEPAVEEEEEEEEEVEEEEASKATTKKKPASTTKKKPVDEDEER